MHPDDKREATEPSQNEADQQYTQDAANLEQLGRERPATFTNRWVELGFCFSLLASMMLAVSTPVRRD